MLDLVVARHDISSSFWDLPSCFYTRNLELEEGFCVPFSQSRDGPWIGAFVRSLALGYYSPYC